MHSLRRDIIYILLVEMITPLHVLCDYANGATCTCTYFYHHLPIRASVQIQFKNTCSNDYMYACLINYFLYWKSCVHNTLSCPIRATVISGSFTRIAQIWLLLAQLIGQVLHTCLHVYIWLMINSLNFLNNFPCRAFFTPTAQRTIRTPSRFITSPSSVPTVPTSTTAAGAAGLHSVRTPPPPPSSRVARKPATGADPGFSFRGRH